MGLSENKKAVIVENQAYYLRDIEEADRGAFLKLMREHRWFGMLLRSLDASEENNGDNLLWDVYTKEGKTYMVCSKDTQEVIGNFYVEEQEDSSPNMTIQFQQGTECNDAIVELVRDFVNVLNKEYGIKAMIVFVNSELERNIFETLGYEKVSEEVLIALPV